MSTTTESAGKSESADKSGNPEKPVKSRKQEVLLTIVVVVFIISWALAAWAKSAHPAMTIGAVGIAAAIASGLIAVTRGRLHLPLVAALLFVLSVFAVAWASQGFTAGGNGSIDAGVIPSDIARATPNMTYSLTVTRPAPRKFLSLTVQVQQLDGNEPACAGDIQFSVGVNGRALVSIPPGVPTNVPVGSAISAHKFTFQLFLTDSNPNATCAVHLSARGTLRD